MLCKNIGVNGAHLTFAGRDTVELAEKYATPLYLMDEGKVRENCRTYLTAMKASFGEKSFPLFASKACCFKRLYEVMKDEGMAVDLVSSGEIHTAMKAGFPMERSVFHGNNKTDFDIAYAMDCGVGYFVADGMFELLAVNEIAGEKGKKQKVLLRLTPGIDPHTYDAVATGKVDSKFGTAIETGQAAELVRDALNLANIELVGYHCHVGSQVFDEEGDVYLEAADIMMAFAAEMEKTYGVKMKMLNLGGGYGVRYVESDPHVDIAANIEKVAQRVKALAQKYGVEMPAVLMEPGRSIVADAGMTLYTAGTVKEITGYKNYVSVDGGMTDNPRFALYGSAYTVHLANRMDEACDFEADVVGRCCESGDVVQPGVKMPKPRRGDIVAVCTTGAYNYSMASNYNRVARPAVVMLSEGRDYVAVQRESLDHLTALDV